ncbi:replication/maintenance protein RepL [Streptomyces sp. NPDC046939]|uniref:replication/maintenance protein RepL n=1 Tax=Streptomyces sp. NPDC046939 TaxID=3155376 RepID=UPI0033CE6E2D
MRAGDHGTDLAKLIAEQFGAGPVHEVKATVYRRPPHDMLGAEGYSLVSDYFLRRVLPYCMMHNSVTRTEIAEEVGVARTSVGHALDALCSQNLIRKVKRGSYELNPRVAYNGNGAEQRDFLAELRALDLDTRFPDELGPELTLFARSDVG